MKSRRALRRVPDRSRHIAGYHEMRQENFDLGRNHIARVVTDMDKTNRRTQSTQASSVRMQ